MPTEAAHVVHVKQGSGPVRTESNFGQDYITEALWKQPLWYLSVIVDGLGVRQTVRC
jgi:hypothetical protein